MNNKQTARYNNLKSSNREESPSFIIHLPSGTKQSKAKQKKSTGYECNVTFFFVPYLLVTD